MGEKLKTNMKNLGLIGLCAIAGDSACVTLMELISYASNRSAAFNDALAKAPAATDAVYNSARVAAENVSKGTLYSGLSSTAVTCFFAGFALYTSLKKDRKSISSIEE